MRILVVDDQPDLLSITSSALESFGFDVLQAENGDRALDLLLDPDNVEILFTDVVMPGINGVELAHHARARHDGISVILTSGYPPPETVIPRASEIQCCFVDFGRLIRRATGAADGMATKTAQ
jgi:CheY-like chemotaxis protein